jgi:UTP-glucose-1-phosphate uridylyltransferase
VVTKDSEEQDTDHYYTVWKTAIHFYVPSKQHFETVSGEMDRDRNEVYTTSAMKLQRQQSRVNICNETAKEIDWGQLH